ncbi:conserved hypothetical protein [Sporisorium reilianum SRZ2]|uniref:Uncharacterized protein n=1 Tax=Sporisorium reilianum (strain SRZ2) TaxID=999809 RepID=E7A3H8_SPORE|nr:conserved hypothetical protein [Sporisorium reilianum SRZ2]
MQALSTPPDLAPSPADKQLSLSSAAATCHPQPRSQSSCSPSPPPTESGSYAEPASASNTPLTLASDSSASSTDSVNPARTHAFRRQATACPSFSLQTHPPARTRPSLASKRVLSEGEVILPRPAKRCRMPCNPTLRKQQACDALPSPSSFVPSVPAITSWRMACEQRRQRHLAKSKSKLQSASLKRATASARTRTPHAQPNSSTKSDVLPELRLLSATRTAPIGWSRFVPATPLVPHMVEVYDERAAKRAPERQRFWPIIDHQLDYTGARMLSLSNASDPNACTHPGAKSLFDPPVSPTSRLPVYTQPLGSLHEDRSPLTPDASPHFVTRSPPRHASQYARDAVDNESRRRPKIVLSPSATLSAVIDFTHAQASQKQTQSPQGAAAAAALKSSKPDLAAHAPVRIAPRRSMAAAAASSDFHRSRDYFGHWETYLCNFGKESTF